MAIWTKDPIRVQNNNNSCKHQHHGNDFFLSSCKCSSNEKIEKKWTQVWYVKRKKRKEYQAMLLKKNILNRSEEKRADEG